MCARFTLPSEDAIRRLLDVEFDYEFEIRYNVAPSVRVPAVVRTPEGSREMRPMVWGLRPFWSKAPLINAKAESATSNGAFKESFALRRCLIAAAAFYEWRQEGGIKQPYLFRMRDAEPFAFGGFWQPGDDGTEQCLVMTCPPNELVAPIHDRMPVIIRRDDYGQWLADADPQEAQRVARLPFEADGMESYPVTPKMNSPRFESPECLLPTARQTGLFD